MCCDFMNKGYVKNKGMKEIYLNDEAHFVPLINIYIGVAADTMQSIITDLGSNNADVKLFYTHCKDFQMECVRQIQTRFDSMEHFDFLLCLPPEVAQNLIVFLP